MNNCPLMAHAAPDGCDWCGNDLPPKRRRWCSEKCRRTYVTNHKWSRARAAAKRKARSGLGEWRCAHCGDNHPIVEVNHIEPCMGNHSRFGCWHHADNLEVLCVPCHREVTRQQRQGRVAQQAEATDSNSVK